MASGHVNQRKQAEHMAAPTNAAAYVKKILANSELSTHGVKRTLIGTGAECIGSE